MSDPDNLVLVYLRRMDAKLDSVIETQADHGHRLSRVESQLAGLRRDQGSDAEAVALIQAQMDRLRDRLTRIERRLDIAEP